MKWTSVTVGVLIVVDRQVVAAYKQDMPEVVLAVSSVKRSSHVEQKLEIPAEVGDFRVREPAGA